MRFRQPVHNVEVHCMRTVAHRGSTSVNTVFLTLRGESIKRKKEPKKMPPITSLDHEIPLSSLLRKKRIEIKPSVLKNSCSPCSKSSHMRFFESSFVINVIIGQTLSKGRGICLLSDFLVVGKYIWCLVALQLSCSNFPSNKHAFPLMTTASIWEFETRSLIGLVFLPATSAFVISKK